MSRGAAAYGMAVMRFVELALSAMVSAALCYTVQGGFNISEAVHGAVWLDALVCLALQGILLAGVFAPRRKVVAFVGYALVSLVACAVSIAVAPAGNPIADQPQNPFVATALFVVVNLAVFALARRRVTCVVMFGLGAFVCGFTQFLYTMNMLVAAVAFLVSAGMLVAFRAYSETADLIGGEVAPLLGSATLVGSLLPLAACAAAAVVVLGVVMPLNPPHASIKLLNEYVAYEEDRVKTSVELDENAEKTLTSSTVDEALEPRTTTDLKTDTSIPPQVKPEQEPPQEEAKDYLSGDYSDVDLSGLIDDMQALALDPPFPWGLVVGGILLLAVLLLTLPRYIVHRVRLRRIAAQAPREQIASLYAFFLSRFKKLGMEKPATASPVEYANLFRRRLAPYVGAQEAGSFDHLTALLVQQEYAGAEPDAEDLEWMYWLYRMFYKRCRKELGLFNYGFRRLTL